MTTLNSLKLLKITFTALMIIVLLLNFLLTLYTDSTSKLPEGQAVLMMPTDSNSGIGNQLFSYAISYSLSRRFNIPLLLVVRKGTGKPKQSKNSSNISTRDAFIQSFILPKARYFKEEYLPKKISSYDITCEMGTYKSLIPKEALSKDFLMIGPSCNPRDMLAVLAPYKKQLQTIKIKLNKFSFYNDYRTWKTLIQQASWPVAVDIRREDQINWDWNATIKYFQAAMKKMKTDSPKGQNPTFFVFSDEMELARKMLVREGLFWAELRAHIFFISDSFKGLTNIEELDLMIRCKSIIISGSTFSWWAAYLMKESGEKIVIRPKLNPAYFNNATEANSEYGNGYPDEWIPMDVEP